MSVKQVLKAVLQPSGEGLATFLLAYLQSHEADLAAAWRRGFEVLRALHAHQFPRSEHRKKLPALAVDPQISRAIQTAVVSDAQRNTHHQAMLAMLAIEGSDASVDALMPHVVRAGVDRGQLLDDLRGLTSYAAKTPAMRALMNRIAGLWRERHTAVLSVARELGFSGLDAFRFSLSVDAPNPARTDAPPLFIADIQVDCGKAHWLTISVDDLRPQRGLMYRQDGDAVAGSPNQLKLPPCHLRELPEWLALVADRLGGVWGPVASLESNLDEAHEEALLRWVGFSRLEDEIY